MKKEVMPINPFDEIETVSQKAIVVDKQPEVYFEPVKWKEVIPTYRCKVCGYCEPSRDEMILHVLTHVQEKDRDKLFEKLVKE